MGGSRKWLYKILSALLPVVWEWLASLLNDPVNSEEVPEKEAEKPRSGIVGT